MYWIITKYLLTAAVVVLVSEVAKRSDKLGGFIAALPLVTVLALIWLYVGIAALLVAGMAIFLGRSFSLGQQSRHRSPTARQGLLVGRSTMAWS